MADRFITIDSTTGELPAVVEERVTKVVKDAGFADATLARQGTAQRTIRGQVVASNCWGIQTVYGTAPGAAPTGDGTSRTRHRVASDCSSLRLGYNNLVVTDPGSNTYTETNGSQAYTIKASIEIAGTIYPVTFGGQPTITIQPGTPMVFADPLGVDLAAGTIFYVRTYLDTGGGQWFANTIAWTGNLDGGWIGEDRVAGGTINDMTHFMYGPAVILGSTDDPGAGSALIVGDSIAAGYLDGGSGYNAYHSGGNAAGGYIVRALVAGGVGWVNVGHRSDLASQFALDTNHRRLAIGSGLTDLVCEYGRNDISNSRTLAQVQGDLIKIWRLGKRHGFERVWQTTITPRTSSTDSWATLANQTPHGTESVRVALNDWLRDGAPMNATTFAPVATGASGIRAGVAGHPLRGYFDAADYMESARNSGLWKVNGSANYYTTDGLHPNATASAAAAACIPTPKLTFHA